MTDTKSEEGFENLDEDDQEYMNRVSRVLDGYTFLEEWKDKYQDKDPECYYRGFNKETGQLKRAIDVYGYAIVLDSGKPVEHAQGGLTTVLCKISKKKKAIIDRLKGQKVAEQEAQVKRVNKMNADGSGNLTKI